MGRGGKCTFISATNKENFEEFRERVYEAVRHIHITRFPYNKFLYPDYKDAIEKKTKTTKKSSNFL
jgi:GTP-binding protein HflX